MKNVEYIRTGIFHIESAIYRRINGYSMNIPQIDLIFGGGGILTYAVYFHIQSQYTEDMPKQKFVMMLIYVDVPFFFNLLLT